jgi:TolB-like protein
VRAFLVSLAERIVPAPVKAVELPLSLKPSIAVLPFTNMSGDPEQEYFSDGITEDIITELSRFRSLVVVARNSSFRFKGQSVDVKEIGRALGAAYVVEGSVRRSGRRVRVTAQLIDTATGNHVWAERYDKDLEDIFAVQDEVVRAIAGVIPGHLDRVAVDGLRRKPPNSLTAYDCELRGRWAFLHLSEGLRATLQWYESALEADPEYAMAHAGLGMAYAFAPIIIGMAPELAAKKGKHHAQRAITLDERNPTVNALAAFAYHVLGEHALTRKHAQRAVDLNPNDPFTLYVKGCALSYTGDPEQALDWLDKSARIDPYAPDDQRLDTLCDTHYILRQYDKVVEIHRTYQNPAPPLKLILAAAFAQLGEVEKARAAVAEYRNSKPPDHDLSIMIRQQIAMCSRPEDRDHWLEGYRKAGIEV